MQQNDGASDTAALYAWLSREPETGLEGIVAMPTALGVTPLVFADGDRAQRLRPYAQAAATARGHAASLVRFTRQETLAVVEP